MISIHGYVSRYTIISRYCHTPICFLVFVSHNFAQMSDFIINTSSSIALLCVFQLLSSGSSSFISQELSSLNDPCVELLLDFVFSGDVDGVLSENSIVDFLNSLDQLQSGDGSCRNAMLHRFLQLDSSQ